ncbi:MAG: ATP-binding protein, partial [Moorellales bacterium]
AKTEVLVLDEWGTAPLNPIECRELFEVIDDRAQKRSTVIASQLPLEAWHAVFADPTIADAILDRLVHNAHKINLRGSLCGRYWPGPCQRNNRYQTQTTGARSGVDDFTGTGGRIPGLGGRNTPEQPDGLGRIRWTISPGMRTGELEGWAEAVQQTCPYRSGLPTARANW